MKQYNNIDEYIANFPEDVQAKLQQIRKAIVAAAPEAKEKIAYGIPTFTLNGNLIHFGGYDTHFGLYPGSAGVAEFKERLKDYETSKGTIRFPLDKPLPLDLIHDITIFCVMKNVARKMTKHG